MAHDAQLAFLAKIRRAFPEAFSGVRVLEIGSLDINGSVRTNFHECDYVGIDVAPGPGVDVVCQGQDYDGAENSFDVVISCEVMEHNPYWAETMGNMVRVCKPGGMVIMTCATLGRPEHGTERTKPASSPLTVGLGWTYYRNLTAKDFREKNAVSGLTCFFAYDWIHYDLYMMGIKEPADEKAIARLRAIERDYRRAHWTSWRSIRRAARAILRNKRN